MRCIETPKWKQKKRQLWWNDIDAHHHVRMEYTIYLALSLLVPLLDFIARLDTSSCCTLEYKRTWEKHFVSKWWGEGYFFCAVAQESGGVLRFAAVNVNTWLTAKKTNGGGLEGGGDTGKAVSEWFAEWWLSVRKVSRLELASHLRWGNPLEKHMKTQSSSNEKFCWLELI